MAGIESYPLEQLLLRPIIRDPNSASPGASRSTEFKIEENLRKSHELESYTLDLAISLGD